MVTLSSLRMKSCQTKRQTIKNSKLPILTKSYQTPGESIYLKVTHPDYPKVTSHRENCKVASIIMEFHPSQSHQAQEARQVCDSPAWSSSCGVCRSWCWACTGTSCCPSAPVPAPCAAAAGRCWWSRWSAATRSPWWCCRNTGRLRGEKTLSKSTLHNYVVLIVNGTTTKTGFHYVLCNIGLQWFDVTLNEQLALK